MCRYSIRPHHLLCLQFFEGKGYSNGFVENMTKIHNEMLSKNPYVELTEGADDICENCPNNENGICTQEKSVSGNDRRTYEAIEDELKKQKGDLTWNQLTEMVHKCIIDVTTKINNIKKISLYRRQPICMERFFIYNG